MKAKKLLSFILVMGLLIQCIPAFVFATDTLNNIEKIVTAESRSFFITSDGKVYASGSNSNGISGLGNLTLSTDKAVEIPYISNVKDIAANSTATYFVLKNGDVYKSGQGVSSSTPSKVSGLSGVSKITTNGNSVIAVKTDGTVYIQGDNSKGQLGAGSTQNVSTFTKLSGVSNVKDVQMGNNFSVFLFDNGSIKSTGEDVKGRLGLGNSNSETTIVRTLSSVSIPSSIEKIAVGHNQVLYLGSNNVVYTTGPRADYIGVGTGNSGVNTLTEVTAFQGKSIKDIKSAEGSFVLLNDNTLWSIGLNSYGQSLTSNNSTHTYYSQVATNVWIK